MRARVQATKRVAPAPATAARQTKARRRNVESAATAEQLRTEMDDLLARRDGGGDGWGAAIADWCHRASGLLYKDDSADAAAGLTEWGSASLQLVFRALLTHHGGAIPVALLPVLRTQVLPLLFPAGAPLARDVLECLLSTAEQTAAHEKGGA